jgi:hypothetical protein
VLNIVCASHNSGWRSFLLANGHFFVMMLRLIFRQLGNYSLGFVHWDGCQVEPVRYMANCFQDENPKV